MKRKLNTTLGFYSPSFLRMHVGTNKSLINLNTLNDDFAESVYLHEYCHFIQDLSTNYGLSNLCATVDYMKFVNNYLIKQPKGDFPVPILPIPNSPDNVDANNKLFSIYNGDGDADDVQFSGYRKLYEKVQSNSDYIDVPYLEVEYDENGISKTFIFGAICILENMAYIIESECYSNCEPSPDIPYKAAEKLVDLIFPLFGQNRLNVLALCDASLKHINPGIFFYETLLEIKTNNIVFNQPEEIYAMCNRAIIDYNGATSLNELLISMRQLAISQILGYFNDPQFQPLKDWLENMINKAVDFRIQNETFPLDLARSGKIAQNTTLASFITHVGSPLITNDSGETTIVDARTNSITPNYLTIWAIDQIHSLFWGQQNYCELVELCNQSSIKTDERCTNEPWQRNLDPKCAFGQMWRHWGLTDYSPIF